MHERLSEQQRVLPTTNRINHQPQPEKSLPRPRHHPTRSPTHPSRPLPHALARTLLATQTQTQPKNQTPPPRNLDLNDIPHNPKANPPHRHLKLLPLTTRDPSKQHLPPTRRPPTQRPKPNLAPNRPPSLARSRRNPRNVFRASRELQDFSLLQLGRAAVAGNFRPGENRART